MNPMNYQPSVFFLGMILGLLLAMCAVALVRYRVARALLSPIDDRDVRALLSPIRPCDRNRRRKQAFWVRW